MTQSARKLSPVAQAYERSKIGREALFDLHARAMECTEDKAGIVWERFVLPDTGHSVILFATPSWWDIFATIDSSNMTDATIDALKALARA